MIGWGVATLFLGIFDISADTLLHCYAVDEQENGEAIHLFAPIKR